MTIVLCLTLSILGLFLSALFSGFENGMVSIRKARLDHAVAQGSWSAMLIKKLLDRPSSMLATVLMGTNLAHCLTAVYFGKLFIELTKDKLEISPMIIQLISAAILTIVMLLLAEITPKIWFRQHPYARCKLAIVPVYCFYIVMIPFVILMTCAVNLMNRLLSRKGSGDVILMREDFRVMLKESVDDGLLNVEDQMLLENSLGFNTQTACNLMVTREDAHSLTTDMTLAEAVAVSTKNGLSRFPVCEPESDRWVGVFSVYDALYIVPQRDWQHETIRTHMRSLTVINAETGVADVLQCSRLNSSPLLVVVNAETNDQLGIITAQDAVRPLFGKLKV